MISPKVLTINYLFSKLSKMSLEDWDRPRLKEALWVAILSASFEDMQEVRRGL